MYCEYLFKIVFDRIIVPAITKAANMVAPAVTVFHCKGLQPARSITGALEILLNYWKNGTAGASCC